MKATYSPTAKTKFTTSHRKEGKCFFRSMSIISLTAKPWHDGAIPEPITCRIYGTGSGNSACLWINVPSGASKAFPEGLHVSGSGRAGGYGYHRPSAAMGEAIRNAGFELSESINGRGEPSMREALLALAKVCGIKRPAIVESYP